MKNNALISGIEEINLISWNIGTTPDSTNGKFEVTENSEFEQGYWLI